MFECPNFICTKNGLEYECDEEEACGLTFEINDDSVHSISL